MDAEKLKHFRNWLIEGEKSFLEHVTASDYACEADADSCAESHALGIWEQVQSLIAREGLEAEARAKNTAWLLESKYHDGDTVWLCSDTFLGCTADPNRAIRFSRREDAEGFIKHHDLRTIGVVNLWTATEHIWMGRELTTLEKKGDLE